MLYSHLHYKEAFNTRKRDNPVFLNFGQSIDYPICPTAPSTDVKLAKA